MEKSIEKKMIERILSHPYQAMEGFVRLDGIKKQQEKYTIEDIEECFPFLREEDLEIDNLTKILDSVEKQIIREINSMVQDEENKNLHELMALVMALDTIVYKDHEPVGLIKDFRVEFCYDLMKLIDSGDRYETEFWLNENLKKLRFN